MATRFKINDIVKLKMPACDAWLIDRWVDMAQLENEKPYVVEYVNDISGNVRVCGFWISHEVFCLYNNASSGFIINFDDC